MDSVYVVVRRSKDTAPCMVEILGVFKNKEAAEKWREDVFQVRWITAEIEVWRALDD